MMLDWVMRGAGGKMQIERRSRFLAMRRRERTAGGSQGSRNPWSQWRADSTVTGNHAMRRACPLAKAGKPLTRPPARQRLPGQKL